MYQIWYHIVEIDVRKILHKCRLNVQLMYISFLVINVQFPILLSGKELMYD